jgi:membrane-bound lytic murein transglycosylase D
MTIRPYSSNYVLLNHLFGTKKLHLSGVIANSSIFGYRSLAKLSTMSKASASMPVLVLCLLLLYGWRAKGQSIPEVPFDINFADVTIHLNEQGRLQVQQEVSRIYANRNTLRQQIESLRQLSPLLQPLLSSRQLPTDYRYLVLPFASDTSAAYWGLTRNRALGLRLRINDRVDERYHPILATEPVANRLSQLRVTSGNYVATLLNYLRDTNVPSQVPTKNSSVYLVLDPQSPPLMWKMLARKIAFEREEPVMVTAMTYLIYEYRTSGGQSIRSIAQRLQLAEDRFQPFNNWLKSKTIPIDKDYPVLVRVTPEEFPVIKGRAEERWQTSSERKSDIGFPTLVRLPQESVGTRSAAVFYGINDRLGVQAQPCDNVIMLAYYGKLKPEKFLEYNSLSDRDVIRPGQIYYLEKKAKRAKVPFHVVQRNETLRDISDIYGVQLESLLKYNDISPTQRVQAGRIIWMQKKRPRNRPVEYQKVPSEILPVNHESVPILADTVIRAPSVAGPVDSVKIRVTKPVDNVAVIVKKPVDTPAVSPNNTKIIDNTLKLHIVTPGQTLSGLAKQYGVTLAQLSKWNNLAVNIPIEVGQELVVGMVEKPITKPAARPKMTKLAPVVVAKNDGWDTPATAATPKYHVVQPGQTVYRVALINKVSVEDVMRWNNLKNYTLSVGQKLLVSAPQK